MRKKIKKKLSSHSLILTYFLSDYAIKLLLENRYANNVYLY